MRQELQDLIPKVKQQQQEHLHGRTNTLPAVLVQFKTQRAAQAAFQTTRQGQPGKMEPRSINTMPNDIIWKNLGIARWTRIVYALVSHIVIVLLILFWSIPVGLVGALANIDSLVDQLPFLSFVNKIPATALDAITGLLPALLISALLALVPIICRCKSSLPERRSHKMLILSVIARQSGAVMSAQVELRTQSWYFAFQVVQVFLITTFSSGASTVASMFVFCKQSSSSLDLSYSVG